MLHKLAVLFLLIILNACVAQKQNTILEKFDISAYQKTKQLNSGYSYYKDDVS